MYIKPKTRFQALFIKLLRVKLDYTWRAVSREWQTRYLHSKPFNSADLLMSSDSNQIEGMDLCWWACEYLGEKGDIEGIWN